MEVAITLCESQIKWNDFLVKKTKEEKFTEPYHEELIDAILSNDEDKDKYQEVRKIRCPGA